MRSDGLVGKLFGKLVLAGTVEKAGHHPVRPVVIGILGQDVEPDAPRLCIELVAELGRDYQQHDHDGGRRHRNPGVAGQPARMAGGDPIGQVNAAHDDGCDHRGQRDVHPVLVGHRLDWHDAGGGGEGEEKYDTQPCPCPPLQRPYDCDGEHRDDGHERRQHLPDRGRHRPAAIVELLSHRPDGQLQIAENHARLGQGILQRQMVFLAEFLVFLCLGGELQPDQQPGARQEGVVPQTAPK